MLIIASRMANKLKACTLISFNLCLFGVHYWIRTQPYVTQLRMVVYILTENYARLP